MTPQKEDGKKILPFLMRNFLIIFCLICAIAMFMIAPFMKKTYVDEDDDGPTAPTYPQHEKGCFGPIGNDSFDFMPD
jgi:hypothetical protein